MIQLIDALILLVLTIAIVIIFLNIYSSLKNKKVFKASKIDDEGLNVPYTGNPDGTAWGTNKYVH